jgi:hypothetical protein
MASMRRWGRFIRNGWAIAAAAATATGLLLWPSPGLPASGGQKFVVVYPRADDRDRRNDYALALLQAALERAAVPYDLRPSRDILVQGRYLADMAAGRGDITIAWPATSIEREQKLFSIRIPIDRGLSGWRLMLVNRETATGLAAVQNLGDLRQYVAGQGHDWPDITVLEANGLQVTAAPDYTGLFLMLRAGHFDYFPRSIYEIWDEATLHAADGLAIEPHLALHYAFANYFFLAKENAALGEALRSGLELMVADGSFDRLFHHFMDGYLLRAGLDHRVVIDLANPSLPPDTPLGNKALWFDPRTGVAAK